MGLLQSYCTLIVNYSGRIIAATTISILSLLLLTSIIRPWPSFRDPRVGLEARDTLISSRVNTWRLLVDESGANQNDLSLNPNSANYEFTENYQHEPTFNSDIISNDLNNTLGDGDGTNSNEPPVVEMSMDYNHGRHLNSTDMMDEDEDEYYRMVKTEANNVATYMHYSLDSNQAFCGQLFDGYAQVVIYPSSRQSQVGLLNLNSIISICQLDHKLRLELAPEDRAIFQNECERFQVNGIYRAQEYYESDRQQHQSSSCCNSWSLPNYIACLSNQTSCFSLEVKDIKIFESLLYSCAQYYFKAPYEECFIKQKDSNVIGKSNFNILNSPNYAFDKGSHPRCGYIPDKCLRCGGWTYNVMHYLVNNNLLQTRNESNTIRHHHRYDRYSTITKTNSSFNKLTHTNIFLPIPKSPTLMKYYQSLSKYQLKTPYSYVKAMDLGLKNVLFETLLSEDAKLFLVALIAILIVITIQTWSIVIAGVIMLIICLSSCLSYIIYELILDIPIFPFMNLLAIVISFGICSDNAMLFCKQWSIDCTKQPMTTSEIRAIEDATNEPPIYIIHVNNNINGGKNTTHELELNPDVDRSGLDRMLRRAVLGTSSATLATACSFIISAISKVTAVRCFCIFATLSVITNYLLILILLPPALIMDCKFSSLLSKQVVRWGPRCVDIFAKSQSIRNKMITISKDNNTFILKIVARYKYYLIITFTTLLCCSSILVFYRPTLQPADDDQIQLLSTKHAFEQYDRQVRKNFAFEMNKDGSSVDTLPIRVVFGVDPLDNGNIFDSHDKGYLVFDKNFDISEPNAQTWMLEFCKKLKQQRFIKQNVELEYSNCFIETFKSWMERPCQDPVQPEIDRSPCCQGYDFPFSKSTFNKCVGEAVKIIRKTPQSEPNINAGVRFFKNSTRIAAIIIEYQSNKLFTSSYRKMDRFFNDVDAWVSWQINNTAPPSLRSGWFMSSNLEWLALQNELLESTTTSIILEIVFAMFALLICTRDFVIMIAGTITIGTIIIMTVASLIILRWTLGVAESIMISLTIGLSIDFALHYSVAYSESKKNGSNDCIVHGVFQQVGGPIALATITTSVAGFVIIWSDILAYQELGAFLILLAILSWLNSTFFLLPMLASIYQLKIDKMIASHSSRLLNAISTFLNDKLGF